VLGNLTLGQLGIGMALFTIVMVLDIFMFGQNMRKNYLPNALGLQGKSVLIVIGLLICLGWIVPTENSVQAMADVIASNRTPNLEQFAALLESDETNSPMHACTTEHSSDRDFKAPRIGTAQPRLDSGSFRQPAVRSGGAAHRPAVAPRRTPFPAAESLVALGSPWMRGAPQPGFSRHILRIKSRISREMTGRPG
jgi:hypothetical protein